MNGLLRRLPGFRSGKWWKSLIALGFYFFISLTISAILFPSSPSLALNQVPPTNKSSIAIAGETLAEKPVFLLQNSKVLQAIKADSNGKFYFALNDLQDGNYTYTVEACNSERKDKCRSENVLITIDQTPPAKPIIALPDNLPDDSEEKVSIKGVTEPQAKIVVKAQNTELPKVYANDKGEFEVKTSLALGANTIDIKAVDIVGNESEIVRSSIDFNPKIYKAKVTRVIDGDTIKIEGDKVVRYIGIDTPETVHPSKPVQCYGKEASSKNKELVEGKEVKLEKDVSETDKYHRLLRYVWLGDMLVNEYLVSEGYAKSSTYPPDVKYQSRFLDAQIKAREEKKGLWGEVCNPPPQVQTPPKTQLQSATSIPNTQPTLTAPTTQIQPLQQTQPVTQSSGSYRCDCSKTCPQMSSCAEAQYQLKVCGCTARDRDGDGIACDSDCQ